MIDYKSIGESSTARQLCSLARAKITDTGLPVGYLVGNMSERIKKVG
jgi:hypothetical protein